ncbi:MAG: hypothetical protein IJ527_06110 [Prevotella sp.]|nr:hypothetical protein [Prevotella sp.]
MFALTHARAQYTQVRNFYSEEYRAGTQNWSITEGPNQRMFFGNNQGMLVFDGETWSLRYVTNYSVVRALYFDPSTQRIYAGASNELGYFEADTTNSTVRYHSLGNLIPKHKHPASEIWRIIKRGQDIIFQSKEALLVYSEQTQQIRDYRNDQRLECIALVNGQVVVAGNECAMTLTANGLEPLPGTEALRGKVVRSILHYDGKTLFVTNSDGIFSYDGQQTTVLNLPISPYLKECQVFCAEIDGDNLAFGTVRGGVVLYDIKTGRTNYSNINTWLQNNTVLSMMFDRNHNLWLGLDNGISYLQTNSPFGSLFNSHSHIGTGYAAALNRQHLYLGTNQGLFFTPWPITNKAEPPHPQSLTGVTGQIWSLVDVDGTLLCGSDNGAYTIHGTTAERISQTEGTWNFAALTGHEGMVVGCDYKGFFLLERQGNGYRLRNRIEGLDMVSGGFLIDDDGSLWICHWQEGVYHVWLDEGLARVSRQERFHKGNGLLMDEGNGLCCINGRIYISCVDGFYYYDKNKKQLTYDEPVSRIFDTYGTALRIYQTRRGDLWAYKPGYLALARRQADGSYRTDSVSFRRANGELHVGAQDMCSLDEQRMLINGNNGFFVLNNDYTDKSQPTTTFIRRIVGTNGADTLLYQDFTMSHSPLTVVRIPHQQNSIRIEFIQTEYRNGESVKYQCLLEGYDKDWSQLQKSTSKEYTQLSKGTYTFHVRAVNQLNGQTSEATIQIEVLPAWYETWWAYTIYLLLFAVGVWQLLLYLKRRAERELIKVRAEKERQLKEQQAAFSLQQAEQENELMRLKAEQMELEMKQGASKLADSTMNLMRKNDMLLAIDAQMEELSESVRREDNKTSINKKIKDIRFDIQQNIRDDENWEKFEENFNLVYDNYMRKLTEHFPDLKLNDRKLCAYLRMGLSSKEMASLLNTSVRSIETARYRLRKKLQMESGDNLQEFIQSFDQP